MKTFLFAVLLSFQISLAATSYISSNLQRSLDLAMDGDTLILAAGTYEAVPQTFIESTCGNCQVHETSVIATSGFVIENKRLRILGVSNGKTVLVTHAGYGLLCLNSRGTVLENLTVTGGVRDTSGAATNGAIVLKNSTVKINHCNLHGNTNRADSVIVGIGGIMIRENSEAWITNCTIINNGWDGIALYRGATAMITDCVIDSGRGAGIGITWDATVTCLRNKISHYWKGIGTFGTSTAVVRNNAVFDNLGWGIIASGESSMICENNTVVRNGNCGIAIWNQGCRGRMVNNISAFNGWRKEWVCPCVGFMNQESDTLGWVVKNNLVWGNTAGLVTGMDSTKFFITDPMFSDTMSFRLKNGSPAKTWGDSLLTNPDGSFSELGIYGGPHARK